ncbi:4-(cytidine 5'-diphospho)-2-C-methyl-D-erythritol kinase [Lachnobacterium bovis]|uniref:4-diphosphocytidyl-2-C-methyl-D-erythritol kinase n=1 Tax=Lachnobacterium bovis TaxID=140626 RepID=A0A1H9U398_9FIRM|nr:4-(cytidine 5'-diphospho)-2-C-methyl-D-erythritol kinase [Lachnobacterium bovis]SES03553.1 4-diphosphocytidyl-2-C-methyl-D-erythritol kinase [Lachnobacterium bovis]
MDKIVLKALAKINLGLDVVGKRDNGYHDVRMIMQNINIYDKICMEKIPEDVIQLQTSLSFLPVNENNLAYKAAQLMKDEFNISEGVSIKIEKRIPVSAGLAGGSADAAAVLIGMKKLFNCDVSNERLKELSVKLGADVPFCVQRGTALAEGIGEELTELAPLMRCNLLVAKPKIIVPTKVIYQNLKLDKNTLHPDIDGIMEAMSNNDLHGIASKLGNVLETVTIPMHPVIQEIKDKMVEYGALNSLMSGSGPTVFGIFEDEKTLERAYGLLKETKLAPYVAKTSTYSSKR